MPFVLSQIYQYMVFFVAYVCACVRAANQMVTVRVRVRVRVRVKARVRVRVTVTVTVTVRFRVRVGRNTPIQNALVYISFCGAQKKSDNRALGHDSID